MKSEIRSVMENRIGSSAMLPRTDRTQKRNVHTSSNGHVIRKGRRVRAFSSGGAGSGIRRILGLAEFYVARQRISRRIGQFGRIGLRLPQTGIIAKSKFAWQIRADAFIDPAVPGFRAADCSDAVPVGRR